MFQLLFFCSLDSLLGLRLETISLSIERQAAAGPSTEFLRWFHPHEPRRTPLTMQRRTPRSLLTCTAGSDSAALQTSVHGLGLWEEKPRHQEQGRNPNPVGLSALNASPGSVHGAEAHYHQSVHLIFVWGYSGLRISKFPEK